LARLQTSYVDLYQIHRFDKDTPIEETMEALHDLVKAGMHFPPLYLSIDLIVWRSDKNEK
jgi:hypothetical protein